MVDNIVEPVLQNVDICSHGGGVNGQAQVLDELLHRVAPLSSEEPENILRFFTRLQEIYNLGMVTDRFRDKWVPITTARRVLRLRIVERPPIRTVAANILYKQ